MKVLGLVCSPRKEGNTEIMMRELLDSARSAGAETELVFVADKNIAPCDACASCLKTGICKIKDDMQEIYQKLEQADAIVLGTPVYFWNVSAQAKLLIDRTYSLLHSRKLRGKVAGSIVVTRRAGTAQVSGLLYSYYIVQRMIVAGVAMGFGPNRGDVRQQMRDGLMSPLEEARALGKSIVRLTEQLARGKG